MFYMGWRIAVKYEIKIVCIGILMVKLVVLHSMVNVNKMITRI